MDESLLRIPFRYPVLGIRSRDRQILADRRRNCRVNAGDVFFFGRIRMQIKKRDRRMCVSASNALPTTLVERRLFKAPFMKLPIQELMAFLKIGFAEQSWQKTD